MFPRSMFLSKNTRNIKNFQLIFFLFQMVVFSNFQLMVVGARGARTPAQSRAGADITHVTGPAPTPPLPEGVSRVLDQQQ